MGKEPNNTINIGYNDEWPGKWLSNFSEHHFTVDGVECASMEGFLQSLKFRSVPLQERVCSLAGFKAKFKGKPKKWWKTQTLWWRGEQIDRHSEKYQKLLDRAYDALATNQKFQKALIATGDARLTHTIGKSDPRKTILTVHEFVSRLYIIRQRLNDAWDCE